MIKKFISLFCFLYLSMIQMKAAEENNIQDIFENEFVKRKLQYKKSIKGRFQQYGDPLFFAAPISLWLTSRYLSSRNIKPNVMKKIKKASHIGMEAHLCYRVSKECYSLYQAVSNGENPLENIVSDLKDNFCTRLFAQTFYFSKSLFESKAFLNFLLIFSENLKKHSEKKTNVHITINVDKKDTKATAKIDEELEERESKEKKKEKKENPLALVGLLAVPVIVTVGLLWASVYNQPFFRECKELEKLLLADNLKEATSKYLEYYKNIIDYNLFLQGDAKQRAKEDLEKSLEVLIYNKKLIEKNIDLMKTFIENVNEKNPYESTEEPNVSFNYPSLH